MMFIEESQALLHPANYFLLSPWLISSRLIHTIQALAPAIFLEIYHSEL